MVLCAENRTKPGLWPIWRLWRSGLVVPAYTTNTDDDHAYLVSHSEASLVICSGGKVADSLLGVLAEQDRITDVICMDRLTAGQEPPEGLRVHELPEVLTGVRADETLDEVIYVADEEDPACLIYTSGTGGRPKGVADS